MFTDDHLVALDLIMSAHSQEYTEGQIANIENKS